MKSLALVLNFLTNPSRLRNLRTLGRLFSVIVLLSGSVFVLVLLPFMFIQFFYVPWLETQAAARAPRELSAKITGHVILTTLGNVERSLIRMLKQSQIPYVLLVSELNEALKLHDEGLSVMVGEIDDRATYLLAGVERASLVVAAQRDTTNTNIAFTVREISTAVSIVATASSPASVDILELAGCNRVLQLGEMLGQSFARRVLGRDAKCHVVGEFGDLLIAEAAAAGTPLVGRALKDIRLAEYAKVISILRHEERFAGGCRLRLVISPKSEWVLETELSRRGRTVGAWYDVCMSGWHRSTTASGHECHALRSTCRIDVATLSSSNGVIVASAKLT